MSRTWHRVALALLVLLAACHRANPSGAAKGPRVDARAHDAYYLWPGVRPPAGTRPRLLYLLDGEIRRDGPCRLTRLRPGTPRLPGQEIWLVVRIDRLDRNAACQAAQFAEILADMARWQQAGNRLAGLQIDFDAATRGIGRYAAFLADARRKLPQRWRLSITGLMDWSAHGDPVALAALRTVVDEVVVQTYQGRDTIPGYEGYFRRMHGFPIPFRVALAEHGVWRAPPGLASDPEFRGYVVFLLPPTRISRPGSAP